MKNYADIVEIKDLTNLNEVNSLLQHDWLLINTSLEETLQNELKNEIVHYIVGRPYSVLPDGYYDSTDETF